MVNINLKTTPEDFPSAERAKLSTTGLTIAIKDRNSQSGLYTQLRDTFGVFLELIVPNLELMIPRRIKKIGCT
ncbi:MAG: hypothetical protein WBX01_01605 [Nitrososphaeraceae archaeon]